MNIHTYYCTKEDWCGMRVFRKDHEELPCPNCGAPTKYDGEEAVIDLLYDLSSDLKEAQDRLDDYQEDFKSTVNEKCDPEKDDRVHCTCVPHLRKRIEELEGAMRKAMDASEGGGDPYKTIGRATAVLAIALEEK